MGCPDLAPARRAAGRLRGPLAAMACVASSWGARLSRGALLTWPHPSWVAVLVALCCIRGVAVSGSRPRMIRCGGARRPSATVGLGGFSGHAPSPVWPSPVRCRRGACSAGGSQRAQAQVPPTASPCVCVLGYPATTCSSGDQLESAETPVSVMGISDSHSNDECVTAFFFAAAARSRSPQFVRASRSPGTLEAGSGSLLRRCPL